MIVMWRQLVVHIQLDKIKCHVLNKNSVESLQWYNYKFIAGCVHTSHIYTQALITYEIHLRSQSCVLSTDFLEVVSKVSTLCLYMALYGI